MNSKKTPILFVDDQWCRPEERDTLIGAFGELLDKDPPYVFHYETAATTSGGYGIGPVIKKINSIPGLAAVVLDIMFGDQGDRLGLDILEAIREKYPTLPVLMMTSLNKNNLDVVERAMELGANEYLIKKPTLKEMENVLNIYTQPFSQESDFAIWGNSKGIRDIRAIIARVAVSGSTSVLITGESGTGKELAARAIYRQGPRRHASFIDKNCAHEKSNLLDSDLFGHEKGAFTGADKRHIGRIERADKGVLFLDEIGDMSPELQGKLLRVLETREFQRIGGTENITSDFQLICATNETPADMVKDGRLREDLYFRIKQIEINLPGLHERKEDISILAEYFLHKFIATSGASYKAEKISKNALGALEKYTWPGNIRELKNAIERAAIFCRNIAIDSEDLPAEIAGNSSSISTSNSLQGNFLPEEMEHWGEARVINELKIIAEALEKSQNATVAVKHLFPLINSPNATYLKRYIKRLCESPWGCKNSDEIERLIKHISNLKK